MFTITAPSLKRHPAEYFGYPYTIHNAITKKARKEQYCPFLDGECKKPRKSQPEIKVGVCSVGYKGSFSEEYVPVIICPHRFKVGKVFETIKTHCFADISDDYELGWAPEVSMGTAGSIDYAIFKRKKYEPLVGGIEDFVCVEFQGAGTTGTPWEAVREFKKTGKFLKEKYAYGINWANEFVKTMMQQVYKKGIVVETWNK